MRFWNQSLVASVYILLEKEDKILMMRRLNTGFADGEYSLVAGHVEENESFEDTAIRELNEEIGINIDRVNLDFFHLMYRATKLEKRVDIFFSIKKWDGEVVNMEPSKCDDLIWTEPNKLPKNTLDYVAHAIGCRERKIKTSEWVHF